MNKAIFVHSLVRFNAKTPFLLERKNESFASFLEAGQDNGVEICVSHFDAYDSRKKAVRRSWVYDSDWRLVKNKKVELCYYHGKTGDIYHELERLQKKVNIPMINHTEIEKICDDKLLTYRLFPEMMPKTFLPATQYDMQTALQSIRSPYIVVKPRFGSKGCGVFITEKQRLSGAISNDMILQEFVDSSNGIMGIRSVHDFRVLIINGKIDHSYVRLPQDNSLICNSSQGGSKVFISNDEIPQEIVGSAKRIDTILKDFGTRIYTIDYLQDATGRPWVIELNSKPGTVFYDGMEHVRYKFYANVARAVKRELQ